MDNASTARRNAASSGAGGRIAAYGLLLAMGLAWGLAVSLSKIGGATGAHPLGLAQWQVTVAATFMLIVCTVSASLPPVRFDLARFGLICGAVGIAFPAMALYWAATHLPAGIVAIAFASMPLFTYAMAVMFGLERASMRRLLGVVVGLVAMGLILLPSTALPAPDLAPWVVLTLIASLSMSFENFYAAAYRPPRVSSQGLSLWRQIGAMTWLTPLALATGTLLPVWQSWSAMQWAATGSGLISASAFTCLLYVIKTSGPVFATQTSYLITLAGVGWGMLLFGERHSAFIWLALVLTLAAIALVRPQKGPPAA